MFTQPIRSLHLLHPILLDHQKGKREYKVEVYAQYEIQHALAWSIEVDECSRFIMISKELHSLLNQMLFKQMKRTLCPWVTNIVVPLHRWIENAYRANRKQCDECDKCRGAFIVPVTRR